MPSPHVSFSKRVLSQTMQYDWLGNQTATDDDAHGFYDRSLGSVTNNTANGKPYQLTGAQQTTGTNTGSLETEYDVAGNLVDMAVIRDGDCLPSGAVCSQRFVYDWDEVGRLIRARRWDTASPSVQDSIPSSTPAADLRHSYDASASRVIKTAVDENEESSYTVYIFGTLELRRTSFDTSGTPDDYTDDIDTEVGYLFGNGVRLARLHWDDNGSPAVGGANLHVLFELGDHLGSSSKVLDKSTSDLVDASTYMGYGQAESDYRPGRWKSFREDYRFTGKEEDSEVGLTYFGKRFLSSQLGRWVSADPLTVHSMGADLNLYSYVKGAMLRATDRIGLDASGSEKSSTKEAGTADTQAMIGEFLLSLPFRALDAVGNLIGSGVNALKSIVTAPYYGIKEWYNTGSMRKGAEVFWPKVITEPFLNLVVGAYISVGVATGLEPMGRAPTAEEIAKIRESSGNSVDLSGVIIRDRWSVVGDRSGFSLLSKITGSALTLNNTVHFSSWNKDGDNFLHEGPHLGQAQAGQPVATLKLGATGFSSSGSSYDIKELIASQRPWSAYNVEQRAEFMSKYGNFPQRYLDMVNQCVERDALGTPMPHLDDRTLNQIINFDHPMLHGPTEGKYIFDIVMGVHFGDLPP